MPYKKYLTTEERKAANRAYAAKYYANPEVKAKQREYRAAYNKTSGAIRKHIKSGWKEQGIKFASEFDQEIWLALALYDGTVCEVTGMTNAEHQTKFGKRLCLDHDHQTGEPRRFLARHVNIALGAIEGLTSEQITNLLRLHEEDRRTRDDIA